MRYDSYLEAAYSYPKDLSQKHHLFVPIAALRAAALFRLPDREAVKNCDGSIIGLQL